MSCNKISFTFTIILFISLLDLTYSVDWLNNVPFNFFNGSETECIDNKIRVKYMEEIIYVLKEHEFKLYDGREYIWKAGKGTDIYYNKKIYGGTESGIDAPKFKDNVVFYLINKVKTLENFFNTDNDTYCDKIEEIDFYWFDYSEVTSFQNAFKGLTNLKSITFKNNWKRCDAEIPPKNRPRPTNIANMLQGCTSLESVDLSIFDTSLVEDMSSLLNGCTELKTLDISYFYFKSQNVAKDILTGVQNLKYIGLYDIDGITGEITSLDIFTNNENLIVCQNKQLIQSSNELCCQNEVVNGEINCLPSSNFIVLNYSQNCNYENGFQRESSYRSGKYLIFYKNTLIKKYERLNIQDNDGGLSIIIYFYYPQKSLEKFFDINEDPNMQFLVSIDLSNFDITETVTMSSMFYGCSSLKSLDLSAFETSPVTNMSSMFYGCSSILSIDLRNLNTTNVVDMSNMFYNCTNLEVLHISEIKISENTVTENMFYNVNNLEYLGIDHIEDAKKIITGSPLNSINDLIVCQSEKLIENTAARNICCTYDMEKKLCISDNYIIANFNESSDFTYESGFKIGSEFRKIISFIMEDNVMFGPEEKLEIKSNSKIKIYIFNYITSLEKLFSKEIDDKVEYIKWIDFSNYKTSLITNMNSMFYGCSSLKLLSLSNFKTPLVNDMGSMFHGCSSLVSLDLSAFDTSSVVNMSSLFYGCSSLKILNLSMFKTSKVTNMNSMFYGCSSLKLLDLANFNLSSLTNMNSMFYGCSSLELLDLSNFNTSSKVTNMNSMFYECSSLKILDLSFLNTSLVNDMGSMFYNCSSLEALDLYCLDLSRVTSADKIFDGLNHLQIINLYNIKMPETDFIKESYLNKFDNPSLKVCQTEDFLQKGTNLCNKNESQNNGSNYIIVYFYGSATDPKIEYNEGYLNEYRKGIDKIIVDGEVKKPSESFITQIRENNRYKIEIYFSFPLMSLENFFNDKQRINIVSIDLSHLDFSFIVNMNSAFRGLNWMETIDFPNIKINRLVNMNSMFFGCELLKSLDLSVFNTSSVIDMNSMFSGCVALSSLDLSGFDTSSVIDMNSMFFACRELKSLNLSGFDTSSVIDMNSMFSGCEGLKSLDLSGFDTSSVINMNLMFNGTAALTLLDLSGFDTSSVINMNSMFSGCKKLESIDLSGFNTSSVIDMNSMFSGCAALKSLDLSVFNTSSVINMNSMFFGSAVLTSLDLSGFDTSSLINMNSMFSGCKILESIDLSYFKTSLVNDMTSMFSNCQALEVLDISNFNTENVIKSGSMFSSVNQLKYINIYNLIDPKNIILQSDLKNLADLIICSPANISNCCYFDYKGEKQCISTNFIIIYYENGVEYPNGFQNKFRNDIFFIINRDLGDKMNNSEQFNIYRGNKIAIYFNSSIKTLESFFDINYDPNVENISSIDFTFFDFSEITDMNNLFTGCSSLESIIFPDITSSKISNMSHIFFGCSRLLSVNLSLFNFGEVTDMSYMFCNCSSLKSLNFSDFNTSKVTKMNSMFEGCNSLEKVDLSHCETPLLTNLEKMFYKCQNLKDINLANFTTSSVISMEEMLYDCSSLTYLDISNFDMNNCNSYSNMFFNISNLRFINLKNFKNDKAVGTAFNKAKNLFVCQEEKIITNRKAYYCCDYNFEIDECDNMPTTIVTTIPDIFQETSNINVQMSDSEDIYPSTQNIDEKETYPNDSTEEPNIFYSTEYFTDDNIQASDTTFKTNSINIVDTITNTSIIEQSSYKEENSETMDSTDENEGVYSTSTNEKIIIIDSSEYDTSIIDETHMTTSTFDLQNPTTSEAETQEPSTPKIDTEEPTTPKIDTEAPTTPKIDTEEPTTPKIDTEAPTTPKIDTKEPTTSKEETQQPTESITSKVETKEPISSEIENTEKPSSQNEYYTENTSSPEAEKTEYISPKTSIVDNKEQTTNIPLINDSTEQPTNPQIEESIAETTSYATTEIIDQTTKPSDIEKTSIVVDTEKTNTQAPTKENTEKVVSTSSLPEQITNKPSTYREPETTATPTEREEIKQTTSSPEEEIPTTNKDDNKEVVNTTIPTSLNLTSFSTNLVDYPKTTIIVQNTEEIIIQEKTDVVLVGVSHFNVAERIIKFIIYFSLSQIFAGSKRVKFPVEITTRRVLRVLQTQDAECELIDERKGDLYAYSCEVQKTTSQTIKSLKIINKYEFSSVNYSVSGGVSTLIEGYLDNIQEIGNKLDYLLNSTLYTLENSKIKLGEEQLFNISGVINGTKPKFEKVDLNLSVSAKYENKIEEKQLECSIIDIIGNNYTLNCIGIKNTNISLQNAMSVVEKETLIIRFAENENSEILYYTNETKNRYSIRFFNNKGGSLGAGAIVAIILSCLVAVAAIIISYYFIKKGNKTHNYYQDSTLRNLKI